MNKLQLAAQFALHSYTLSVPQGCGVFAYEFIACEATDTSGMAYVTESELWIAMSGSNSRADWLSNIKVVLTKYRGWMPCHKGLVEATQSVLQQVLDVVARHGAGRRICFVGHSRGGAEAILLAIAVWSVLGAPAEVGRYSVITFGQPKVSQGRYIREAFPGEYIRVVNGSDAVPRRPLLWYSHAGTCVYLRNDGGVCHDPGAVELFLDRLPTLLQRATDHLMPRYIRSLQPVRWDQ